MTRRGRAENHGAQRVELFLFLFLFLQDKTIGGGGSRNEEGEDGSPTS